MTQTLDQVLVDLIVGTIEQTKEALLSDDQRDALSKATAHFITAKQAIEQHIKQRELEARIDEVVKVFNLAGYYNTEEGGIRSLMDKRQAYLRTSLDQEKEKAPQ